MTFVKNIWKSLTKDPNLAGRLLLIALVIAILFAAIALSGPKPDDEIPLRPTKIPVQKLTPSAVVPSVPPSREYVQTTGVIVAVFTIVMIVVIGTLIELQRNKEKSRPEDPLPPRN